MNTNTGWDWVRTEWWWRVSRHFTADKLAMTVAWWLPRKVALWAFVRVTANWPQGPGNDCEHIYRAWERCSREDGHTGPCNGTPCRCSQTLVENTYRCVLPRHADNVRHEIVGQVPWNE